MEEKSYLVIEQSVLPEVFGRVIKAKKLIESGKAKSATQASQIAGISRSAFYKYKDKVFEYENQQICGIIKVYAVLKDVPGVLSEYTSVFFDSGANILTVNQNQPVGGSAIVSVSAQTDNMKISLEQLLEKLSKLSGVESVEHMTN